MSNERNPEGPLKRSMEDIREMELAAFERGDILTGFRLGALRVELQRLASGLPVRPESIGHIVGAPTLEELK